MAQKRLHLVARREGRGERGVTMLMVMTVLATLLVGAMAGVGMQMTGLKVSGLSLANKRAYYCAETGLNIGKQFFRKNSAQWTQYIQTGYVMTGTASRKDPALIYIVGISDNVDEFPPTPNDPMTDHDSTVVIRSECTDPDSLQHATVQQILTMAPIINAGTGIPVRAGAVTYKTTVDFTNSGAIADCNGCGIIRASDQKGGSTSGNTGSSTGAGGPVRGNAGVSAYGVDMRHDQIALAEKSSYPFIWVPLSAEGYVSKLDTATGEEMARYRTGPAYGNPSRTTVDLQGDLLVTNRANNTVTKIGLYENGNCIDRNHDGIITTSGYGGQFPANQALDWTGDWGTIDGAQDECIIWNIKLEHPDAKSQPYDARMLGVDSDNNIFAGGLTGNAVYHVRSTDGKIVAAADSQQGHYGGLLDRDGYVWSMHVWSGFVEKIRPDLKGSIRYAIGHSGYGVALDVNGRVWTSSWTPYFSRIDPDLDTPVPDNFTTINWNPPNRKIFYQNDSGQWPVGCCAQGITTDANGDVYLAGSLSSHHVGHYTNEGTFIRNYIFSPTQDGLGYDSWGTTGVSIDAAGRVWAASYYGMREYVIDPAQRSVVATYPLAGHSYTYSDNTGWVVRNITSPQGTWRVIQNSGKQKQAWQSVYWDANIPSGTNLIVSARSANDLATLQTATWHPVKNGRIIPQTGQNAIVGQFLQVEVKLTAQKNGQTPVVYDVTLVPWAM